VADSGGREKDERGEERVDEKSGDVGVESMPPCVAEDVVDAKKDDGG
jgi:hypothetical protein